MTKNFYPFASGAGIHLEPDDEEPFGQISHDYRLGRVECGEFAEDLDKLALRALRGVRRETRRGRRAALCGALPAGFLSHSRKV